MSEPAHATPDGQDGARSLASASWRGANWGALAGLVAGLLVVRKLAPFAHYGIDALVVFALCIGLGAAIGIGVVQLRKRQSSR
jgi:hypothetical protein